MKQITLTQGKFALVDDEDYEELNRLRSLFLQLIIWGKIAENSAPKFKSWRAMGLECGMDAGTVRKILRKFVTDGKVEVTEDEFGIIHIRLANYEFWQELKANKEGRKRLSKSSATNERGRARLPDKTEAVKTEAEAEVDTASPTPTQKGSRSEDGQKLKKAPIVAELGGEVPQPTSVLELFNAWMLAHEDDLIPYFELHYAHVGGIKQLKSVASEIRESIILSPDHERWDKRKLDGQWGDTIRNWNRHSIGVNR